MKAMGRFGRMLVFALALALLHAPLVRAEEEKKEEEKKYGWFNTADLAYVLTSGNSNTSTLGLKYKLLGVWERSRFEVIAAAVRSQTTTTTRTAFGTADDFSVETDDNTSTDAENYLLTGRYDRNITAKFFWFAGAGWLRNQPAGTQNRYSGFGGLGNIWADKENVKFRTDYGLSYVDDQPLIDDPDVDNTYAALRISWTYWHKFGESTVYTNDFVGTDDFSNTQNYILNMVNAVAVSMSKHLALKASLIWQYDNQPSLIEVPLMTTAANQPATVSIPAKTLDTTFTTSLVINY
jgi:putative salt-induced outer membrane protein YdiY